MKSFGKKKSSYMHGLTSPKGFLTSKRDVGNCIFLKSLEVFGNSWFFWEFLGNVLGILWEFSGKKFFGKFSGNLWEVWEFNDFLWVCWFSGKFLSNFVSPVWNSTTRIAIMHSNTTCFMYLRNVFLSECMWLLLL